MEVHTPTTSRHRVPLGELPLSNYMTSTTTGASPILKPLRNNAKVLRTPPRTLPSTPPHSSTKSINIRPHHVHVYHSPSTTFKQPVSIGSPSRQERIQTPTPDGQELESSSATTGRARSDSTTSTSSSTHTAPVPLARKRDRVMPVEVAEARERADQPIPGSPSPCKTNHTPASSRNRHRRDSSTASLSAFIKSRNRNQLQDGMSSSSNNTTLDEDAFISDDDDDDDAQEDMIKVTPMKLVPSPKEHHTPSGGRHQPLFTQSLNDIFGVNTSTANGSLIIYEDPKEKATPKRRRVSNQTSTIEDNDKENLTPPTTTATKVNKKGTGGRLSLVASATDPDSSLDSSR
ncbi:unnamed protein product [Sympodiomycopsis kandeliae]